MQSFGHNQAGHTCRRQRHLPQMMSSVFISTIIQNIAGKKENAGHQNFLLFPSFQKHSCLELLKLGIIR